MKKPYITVERRDRPAPVTPKHKWLLPLLIVVAVAGLSFAIIVAAINGVLFG
jgi:hypothetical protein